MSDSVFIDTNVFVYSFDKDEPAKRGRARELIGSSLRSGGGIVSFQVVQEFLNVALRKFTVPLSLNECRNYLDEVLMPLCRVFPDAHLYSKALDVCGATGFSFYDSLILAAASVGGCSRLLSEDLQEGREVDGVRIKNPFLE